MGVIGDDEWMVMAFSFKKDAMSDVEGLSVVLDSSRCFRFLDFFLTSSCTSLRAFAASFCLFFSFFRRFRSAAAASSVSVGCLRFRDVSVIC